MEFGESRFLTIGGVVMIRARDWRGGVEKRDR